MTPRRGAALATALALAVLLAACGGDDDRVDTSAATGGDPVDAPAGTATGRPAVGGDLTLRVVFVDDGRLVTGHRRVASTSAVARAALEQLAAGPTAEETAAGFTSALARGTRVGGIDLADGTATVELTPPPSDSAGRAQVVYTLTQFPTIDRVRFGPGDRAVGRADLRDLVPLVFLESVAPGDTVTSPVTVAGEANTFEATVRIQVLGANGAVLADTFSTATSGSGTWGTFSEAVTFDPQGNATGTVRVFWDSPEDGSAQDVTEVPVRFA